MASYGLGSENDDLPAFVVLTPSWSAKRTAQALFTRLWASGFLPAQHQGVALRHGGRSGAVSSRTRLGWTQRRGGRCSTRWRS